MLIRENVPDGKRLHSHIIIRWYLEKAIFFLPLIFVTIIFAYVFLPYFGFRPEILTHFLALAIILACLSMPYFWALYKYERYIYSMRENDLIVQSGMLEQIRHVIPYENIQNVTISRDIFDRFFGLGTIHIETAVAGNGSGQSSEHPDKKILLPGIGNDSNLVTEIITRTERAKSPVISTHTTTELELLAKIHAEIAQLNASTLALHSLVENNQSASVQSASVASSIFSEQELQLVPDNLVPDKPLPSKSSSGGNYLKSINEQLKARKIQQVHQTPTPKNIRKKKESGES